MKRLLFYSLFVLTLLAVPSCGDDDDDEPGGSQDNVYVAKPFSVSETTQVLFSSGNLQYHCKNKVWRFAPLQYDNIGYANSHISDGYNGYIDLFGWGTGDNPTLSSYDYRDYATFTDWGSKMVDGNLWRTLSIDEWKYLMTKREKASEKFGEAEVSGIHGLILLPDDWTLPEGLSFDSGKTEVSNGATRKIYKEKNCYSSEDWQKMESSGAVFLPAEESRVSTIVHVARNEDFGGSYWSSTAYDSNDEWCAYAFSFSVGSDYYYYPFLFSQRFLGHSVRLVRSL